MISIFINNYSIYQQHTHKKNVMENKIKKFNLFPEFTFDYLHFSRFLCSFIHNIDFILFYFTFRQSLVTVLLNILASFGNCNL